jgi:hypothetical protein
MWEVGKRGLSEGQMVCERVLITTTELHQKPLAAAIMQLVKKNVFPKVAIRKRP